MPQFKAKLSVQLQDLLTDSDIFFDEKVTAMGWDEAEHYPEPIRAHLKAMVTEALDTLETEVRKDLSNGGNVGAASVIGKLIAERAIKAGIAQVAFDRGGFQYHGRIKALAADETIFAYVEEDKSLTAAAGDLVRVVFK